MATTRKSPPSAAMVLLQLSSAVNVTPWMSMRTGAPGDPAHSHILVTPRPGSSTRRVRGAGGSPGSSRTTTLHPRDVGQVTPMFLPVWGGKYASSVLTGGAAGHDVAAAEGQLADLDILHQLLQMMPGPVEP